MERFERDFADPRWEQKAQRDMADGKTLGVTGTPTIFVNGERLSRPSYEALKQSLEAGLGVK